MPEIQILQTTTDLRDKSNESWLQNVWAVGDAVEVRPGWGQLAQLDTTASQAVDSNSFGYEKHLGSQLIQTVFGHEQIVSIFSGKAAVYEKDRSVGASDFENRTFVRIYDLATNQHWEEILVRHTSSFNDGALPQWHGSYETNAVRDNSGFVDGGQQQFFFTLFGGDLFFGNPYAGTFVYHPADFQKIRRQQLHNADEQDWHPGYAETCLVLPLALAPGFDSKTHRYLSQGELGAVQAMEVIQNRMVYAVGNTLFFSDVRTPNAIKGNDFQEITSQADIVAMRRFKDALLIYTDTETFYYLPNNSGLASGGRMVRVSDSVGCLSQNTVIEAAGSIYWVDRRGIYSTATGLDIEKVSAPIDPFFTAETLVTNPMTSYFESASGFANPTTKDHPRTYLGFYRDNVSIAYSSKYEAIIVCFPKLNGAWCFRRGWSWWTMESVVSAEAGAPVVERKENLLNPWVVAGKRGFYSVLSNYPVAVNDVIVTSAGAQDDDLTPRSYVICELGRGGGTDRSNAVGYDYSKGFRSFDEDERILGAKYRAVTTTSSGATWYMRPPKILDNGDYLFPFDYVASTTHVPDKLHLWFRYDSTKWKASGWDAAGTDTNIDLLFGSEAGPLAGATDLAATYNAAGAATTGTTANEIRITINGNKAGYSSSYSPLINTFNRYSSPVFYVRFRPLSSSLNGLGITATTTLHKIGDELSTGPVYVDASFYAWSPVYAAELKQSEAGGAEQSVDWAYKAPQVTDGGKQLMARGIYAGLKSRGSATSKLETGWAWGVYNVLLGSDFKGWVSQIVDYDDNISRVVDKLSIRSRIRDSNDAMQTKTFSGTPKWGSTGTPADGNYLIDDSQEDIIAISDSVKGESLSYMVFGFIRNKAERLAMKALNAVIRPAGNRNRRIGR